MWNKRDSAILFTKIPVISFKLLHNGDTLFPHSAEKYDIIYT